MAPRSTVAWLVCAFLPAAIAVRKVHHFEDSHSADVHAWLEKGLEYANHRDLPEDSRRYLKAPEQLPMPWKGSQAWITTFEKAVSALPSQDGVQVDDHQGTPIGEGESIGLVGAVMQMDPANLKLLPPAFQKGLFEPCAVDGCAKWPVALRFSHTNAVGMDLLRIAMKVYRGDEKGEANMLFTETIQSFPIADAEQLQGFVSVIAAQNDISQAGGVFGKMWAVGAALADVGKMLPLRKTKATSDAIKEKWGDISTSKGAFSKIYHSLLPYRIGDSDQPGAMKFRLKPLKAEAGPPAAAKEGTAAFKEAMREQVVATVSEGDTAFEFQIQVATDPKVHPVNDAAAEWDESSAPWVTMGRVTLPKQSFPKHVDVGNVVGSGLWTDGHPTFNSKELLFAPDDSPHTPLGDINLFRSHLYRIYDKTRQEQLLHKVPGLPAKCPFHAMARALGSFR